MVVSDSVINHRWLGLKNVSCCLQCMPGLCVPSVIVLIFLMSSVDFIAKKSCISDIPYFSGLGGGRYM